MYVFVLDELADVPADNVRQIQNAALEQSQQTEETILLQIRPEEHQMATLLASSRREALTDEALCEDDSTIYESRLRRAARKPAVGKQDNARGVARVRHDD